MSVELLIILVTIGTGFLGFVGALMLLWNSELVKNTAHYFLSFAVGAMLGAVFFDLLPEAFEMHDVHKASFFVLVGVLFFFFVEKGLLTQHCHKHGLDRKGGACDSRRLHASSILVTLGDFFHNFFDGVLVATAFLINIPLGISAAIAQIAHELPQEIGDFSILIASGMKKSKVLWLNVLASLGSLMGAILVISLHDVAEQMVQILLPIAAGGFLYIALSDLIPEIHHENDWKHSLWHVVLIIAGLVLLWFVGEFFGAHAH